MRRALVIGNAGYVRAPLANAAADARAVAAMLAGHGFQVDLRVDLGKPALAAAIDDLLVRVGPADEVLFYYAGHGVQVDGESYLLPVDFRGANASAVRADALPLGRLMGGLSERNAGIAVVMLDACRDNPFLQTRQWGAGLAGVASARGFFIAYATGPGEVAEDGEPGRQSPFVAALLTHLSAPGSELESAMREVRTSVAIATSGRQIPWTTSSLLRPYYLSRADSAPTSKASPQAVISKVSLGGQRAGSGGCVDCAPALMFTEQAPIKRPEFFAGDASASVLVLVGDKQVALREGRNSWRVASTEDQPSAVAVVTSTQVLVGYRTGRVEWLDMNWGSTIDAVDVGADAVAQIHCRSDGARCVVFSGYESVGLALETGLREVERTMFPERIQRAVSAWALDQDFAIGGLGGLMIRNGSDGIQRRPKSVDPAAPMAIDEQSGVAAWLGRDGEVVLQRMGRNGTVQRVVGGATAGAALALDACGMAAIGGRDGVVLVRRSGESRPYSLAHHRQGILGLAFAAKDFLWSIDRGGELAGWALPRVAGDCN